MDDNVNPYKHYPKCPMCKKEGPMTDKKVRQCLAEGCKVQLYWSGGYTDTLDVDENELHKSRENIMRDVFKRYIKTN